MTNDASIENHGNPFLENEIDQVEFGTMETSKEIEAMNSNTWYAWFDGATKDSNPGGSQ